MFQGHVGMFLGSHENSSDLKQDTEGGNDCTNIVRTSADAHKRGKLRSVVFVFYFAKRNAEGIHHDTKDEPIERASLQTPA